MNASIMVPRDSNNPDKAENTIGVLTEWEKECLKKNLPVYRAVYQSVD